MSITSRVAVITGGAGGMGQACAARLGVDHHLLLADRGDDRVAEAVQRFRGLGYEVEGQSCDVTDIASVAALADRARELGPVRTLVHTAGVDPVSVKDPVVLLTVNAQGTARVLDAFQPSDPTVPTVGVCVASVGGHRSFAREFDAMLRDPAAPDFPQNVIDAAGVAERPLAAYGLSKRSVIALVESRAKAWGAFGGRLVSVSPGLVLDTTMGRSAASLGSVSGYSDISAIGRPERARELANLIAFVASDMASCLSGCDIAADGGVVAGTNWHLPPERRETWHACSVEG